MSLEISDQVQHKQAYRITEEGWKLEIWVFGMKRNCACAVCEVKAKKLITCAVTVFVFLIYVSFKQ